MAAGLFPVAISYFFCCSYSDTEKFYSPTKFAIHLPCSTLLALVAALAGLESVKSAYAEAVEQGYRFYSYGDAMLIL